MVEGDEDMRTNKDLMDAYGLSANDDASDLFVKDAELIDERVPNDYYYYASKIINLSAFLVQI